jgi:hypothetical protein
MLSILIRMRQVVGLLLLLPLAACTTTSGSNTIPETGYLRVNEMLPYYSNFQGERRRTWLGAGRYGARIEEFSERRITLDLGPQGPGLMTIELNEDTAPLPDRGGSFELAAADHDQAFALSGNYDRYRSERRSRVFTQSCSIRVPVGQVCTDRVDSNGNTYTDCRTQYSYSRGVERLRITSSATTEEFFMQFLDADSTEELARFVESRTIQGRTRRERLSGCN